MRLFRGTPWRRIHGRIPRTNSVGFQQERTIFLQSSSPRPILDLESLQRSLRRLAPIIAESLQANGYWTSSEPVLEPAAITAMRQHSIALRKSGRFEQSWSERVDANGVKTRFDKEGVFACEPDGHDYQPAPDILLYLATVISNLPLLLNEHVTDRPLQLSNQSFNAKLAVTSPGGSTYPSTSTIHSVSPVHPRMIHGNSRVFCI